jgi:ADP-ribosyl-[dinitrogen reductase] hydrolase
VLDRDFETLLRQGRLALAIDPRELEPPASPSAEWNRVEGMLLGLAVGDALGNTSESQVPAARRERYGEIRDYLPNRYAGGRAVGLPSDDTQLAFRTLEHLLENHGELDPERLADRLAQPPVFGMGSTFRSFLDARRRARSWWNAAQPSAGNGALMRIAPVVVPHLAAPTTAVWRDAILAGAITHNDHASNAACAAFVAVLFRALGAQPPVPPGFWLEPFVAVAAQVEGPERRYVPRAPRHLDRNVSLASFTDAVVRGALANEVPTRDACDEWYSGAYLLETVPSVLYILERHGNDPEEAIVRAVNDTRDNDTIAAIVGAAVGALHGTNALPERWRTGLLGRLAENDDGKVFELIEKARGRAGDDPDWLREKVDEAARSGWCLKPFCTTCGSPEFRNGWRAAWKWAARYTSDPQERAQVLAAGLARIERPAASEERHRHDDALRLLLLEADQQRGFRSEQCRAVLRGSWAGAVLDGMVDHARERAAAAVDHERQQIELQAAAELRRRDRQERHEARLAAKVDKDRVWRATHDVPPPRKPRGTTPKGEIE